MKKTTARLLLVFMVLTMVVSPLFSLISFADDMWTEDYYRATSSTGGLTDDDRDNLDSTYIEFMSNYGVDFAALTLTSDRLDEDIEDFARDYYEDCGFGYGNTHVGFQMIYVADTDQVAIVPIGGAEKLLDESDIAFAEEECLDFYDEYGEWGVMYSGFAGIRDTVIENAQGGEDAVPALGGIPDEVTDPDASLSDLEAATAAATAAVAPGFEDYPWDADIQANYKPFNDPDAPRVVDNADLLTDDEETQLADMIAYCQELTGHDLVVVTDVTDYRLGKTEFADDFYDYNGYGIGPDREGALFFCDMDPYSRGGWCSCCGPDTMRLYTEEVANEIDDVVYSYLGSGEYFRAFRCWVYMMQTLFDKGYPNAPEWFPSRGQAIPARTHDASAPRVLDENGLLTDAQEAELASRIAELSSKYGVDIVLAFPEYLGSLSTREYNRTLFEYCCYGLGDSYDGFVMSVRGNGYVYANGFGNAKATLTETARDRIENKAQSAFDDGAYSAAVSCLNDLEHLLRTGRVQKPLGAWIASALAGLAGGSIFGGISAGAAQGKMKTPRLATDAEEYLVRDSVNINRLYDNYLGTTTSRHYNPPEERSSSSGGGHSSYSGGHSSSSGSSHSGSGRSF